MDPAQFEQFMNAFIGVMGPGASGMVARGGRERQLIAGDFRIDIFKGNNNDFDDWALSPKSRAMHEPRGLPAYDRSRGRDR